MSDAPHSDAIWSWSDDPIAVLVGNVDCQPGCRFDGYEITAEHNECIAAAIRANPNVVLRALGFNGVAMADSDCGWVVSREVEAAGAWSTAPERLVIP